MTTSNARADEPVPLGQTAPDTSRDWSGHDWEDDVEWADVRWDDWFDYACEEDWTWEDWYGDPPADTAPAAEAPAAREEPPASDPPPSEAPAREPASAEVMTADTQLASSTTTAATLAANDVLAAPAMTTSGNTVSWTPIPGVSSYVFVRKVPNQTPQYSIVYGTSVTPPTVPGQTVNYGVRTNVSGSAWASEVSIAYPSTTTVDPRTAPRMSVSGNTVSWTAIPGASSYVFVRKVPNQTPQYSIVNATSVTPPVVSGTTVNYGVRTNVSGSAWANEVAIAYPASGSPSPSPSPTPTTPTPIDGTFRMGVVAGSAHQYELSFLRTLGVRTARIEFGVGTSASSLASDVDAYARAGIRPLLLATFYGRNPSTAEAQNLANWARAYGPGGSFWAGKSYPANTAVTQIEFGNETSYTYQFSDNSSGTYAARAQTYAQRARDAATAIRAANPNVGLLVQADNAQQQTAWVQNMFRAVPNLGDLAAGWTIHPYGPSWASRVDSTINATRTAGSRDLPIWITEWGLSSDNGRCLSDNYGWNRCMTYGEAASTLHSVLSGMHGRYGSRLGAFYLYQAHDQYASGTKTGREAYFGALQSNGTAKGAYTNEVKANLAVN
ncbi:MAG TPA: cellulase family glycosylhydrolase [Conexibacter sp.]|nr:cellulase family glycosylhydrolase [Conexibacter sp.]